ncbi:kinase-like protein [Exidia glandulosa HHB12029]|uniref:Kinase-like protein n=1 Tax=Exidia glandulosa HHB12029 TaxID=1314781 RepID=A0A166NCW6_EXIGL|nr:kinase-like protein [Exidia glandulosa HHB12029]
MHLKLGKVAVKRPRFTSKTKAAKEERLMKECSLLAELDHGNILRCIGYCAYNDARCLVTPWAENGTMSLYLGTEAAADRQRLLADIASALVYLHTRPLPIVHGDLHVDNVLINVDGRALLSDFGLSRELHPEGAASATRTSLGRLVYTAPELHDGYKPSLASDVFAFGMLIVETYSGQRPLARAATDLAALRDLHMRERPSRDEITRADFPLHLWELAEECWAHDPALRPNMVDVLPRLTRIPE